MNDEAMRILSAMESSIAPNSVAEFVRRAT